MHSFIHSFIHSCIHSFIHSFIYLDIYIFFKTISYIYVLPFFLPSFFLSFFFFSFVLAFFRPIHMSTQSSTHIPAQPAIHPSIHIIIPCTDTQTSSELRHPVLQIYKLQLQLQWRNLGTNGTMVFFENKNLKYQSFWRPNFKKKNMLVFKWVVNFGIIHTCCAALVAVSTSTSSIPTFEGCLVYFLVVVKEVVDRPPTL